MSEPLQKNLPNPTSLNDYLLQPEEDWTDDQCNTIVAMLSAHFIQAKNDAAAGKSGTGHAKKTGKASNKKLNKLIEEIPTASPASLFGPAK